MSKGAAALSKLTLNPPDFLKLTLPIPSSLEEQRSIVARIEALAARVAEARELQVAVAESLRGLLLGAYRRITATAKPRPLGEVAPLTRRPANIDPLQEYPQVSVRSFGKGTFHNPPLLGSNITWERPHLVKAGDILISNIKAWEGAIAVANAQDNERYGSHRYLTLVPVPNVATARFLCFHLLTPEGLQQVGEVSPGSADRNRTLSAKGLLEVPVPVPPYEQQLWFGELHDKVDKVQQLQAETAAELDALLPAVLDRAFQGEL